MRRPVQPSGCSAPRAPHVHAKDHWALPQDNGRPVLIEGCAPSGALGGINVVNCSSALWVNLHIRPCETSYRAGL